ncbi:transporter substrate-binding domain-containing protein [Bifidobacterium pullorum]|nr:transporter substrate-binding domain-containing protein [Bifidobacterium pullorum]
MPKRHRPVRRLAALALAAAAMTPLAGCAAAPSTGGAPSVAGQPGGPTIAIGVATDEPGMGLFHDGAYSGFEVDVARYVAGKLGYASKQIIFRQARPSDRAAMLADGTVDMVLAGYAMTDANEAEADFAGPYLTVSQDLLVRASDATAIRSVADMAGRTACVVVDGAAGAALKTAAPAVRIQERDTYPQCVTALIVGEADAIAADDAILSGLAAAKGHGYLTLVGDRYGAVDYGIAVKDGDSQLAARLDTALRDMSADGTRARLLAGLQAETGYRTDGA